MPKISRHKLLALEAQAKELRRGIRAAQLRVALDKQRGRVTPEAVLRVANRKFPEVILVADHLVGTGRISHGTVGGGRVWTQNGPVKEVLTNTAVTQSKDQHPASQ